MNNDLFEKHQSFWYSYQPISGYYGTWLGEGNYFAVFPSASLSNGNVPPSIIITSQPFWFYWNLVFKNIDYFLLTPFHIYLVHINFPIPWRSVCIMGSNVGSCVIQACFKCITEKSLPQSNLLIIIRRLKKYSDVTMRKIYAQLLIQWRH